MSAHRLDITDWGLPKGIITDRDRKFLSDLWTAIFKKTGGKNALLHSLPPTDGRTERKDQSDSGDSTPILYLQYGGQH